MICTFFGHRDTSWNIEPVLAKTVLELIANKGVTKFFVGYQGNFDRIALSVLKQIKRTQPHIDFVVVLAYLTDKVDDCLTLYPEGLEKSPKRYAISARNKWMVENSDYVVTYITRDFGGAVQFKNFAKKKGKTVIELAL